MSATANVAALLGAGSDRTRLHGGESVDCPEMRGQVAVMRCAQRQKEQGCSCAAAAHSRVQALRLRVVLSQERQQLASNEAVPCGSCGRVRYRHGGSPLKPLCHACKKRLARKERP